MYYYEHTNGSIIAKHDYPVDAMGATYYFDSDFVVRWWHEPERPTEPEAAAKWDAYWPALRTPK